MSILSAYLEIVSTTRPGHVKIKGIHSNFFIAMNKEGLLYGAVRY